MSRDRKNEAIPGIVNVGGVMNVTGCAVGPGATIVNGEVTKGTEAATDQSGDTDDTK